MQQRNDGGQSKGQLKSRGDVNEDTDDSKAEGDQGIAGQLVADKFANLVILLDAELGLWKFFVEQSLDSITGARGAANGEEFLPARSLRLNDALLQINLLQCGAYVAFVHLLLRF